MHTEENGDVAVLVLFGLIHLDIGGGIKILILRHVCCLWPWRVSWGLRRRQQNPDPEALLLPLVLAGFIGSSAVAAKS